MNSPQPPSATPVPEESIRLRAALAELPPYVPGRPAPDDGMQRFKVSSNESPFPPLPAVRDALVDAIDGINRYPDMGAAALRAALGSIHDVPPAQIAVGTGSVAVTGDLVRALVDPGDEVVYAWRSFEAYPLLVGSHGGRSVRVPLTEGLEHDLPAMAAAVTDRTRLIILCTPNNPTGPALSTAQIQDFLDRVPAHVVVALDEAYREFVDPDARADTAALFAAHPNVVLLRTFSKVQGIAGLRIGYAVAHPRLASALGQVGVPFGAGSLSQAAALACLQPDALAELAERAAHLRSERARVITGMREQGWEIPDSQGNFVYLPLGAASGEFAAFADARGLVVRAYGEDGVRITIAEPEANDRTLEVTGAWLTDGEPGPR